MYLNVDLTVSGGLYSYLIKSFHIGTALYCVSKRLKVCLKRTAKNSSYGLGFRQRTVFVHTCCTRYVCYTLVYA